MKNCAAGLSPGAPPIRLVRFPKAAVLRTGCGVTRLVPNGVVKVGGVSFGGGLVGGFSGGVTATSYSSPTQLGKYWAFTPLDWVLYAATQVCK